MALGFCGIALCATPLMEWGSVRVAESFDGATVMAKVSFPGIGNVGVSHSVGRLRLPDMELSLVNTNAGWPMILFGVLIAVVALAYWRLRERILALAAVVLGAIATALLAYQLIDLQSTFGDQPEFVGVDISPGPGLLGALVLAIGVVGIGVYAQILERQQR